MGNVYIGDSNSKARKIKSAFIGIDGKARKIKKIYVGDANGKARLAWQSIVEAGSIKFTSSTTWTVPSGIKKIDIFCCGGGGGGGGSAETVTSSGLKFSDKYYYGSCGAGGYTATKLSYDVTPGQQLEITVGKGGAAGLYYYYQNNEGTITNYGTTTTTSGITNGGTGGTSKVVLNGTTIISANGGTGGNKNVSSYYVSGVNGGSGSSSSGSRVYDINGMTTNGDFVYYPGTEGSNGGNGSQTGFNNILGGQYKDPYVGTVGKGQGTTTKEFGESNGTLYSTAGGNSSDAQSNTGHGGAASTRPYPGADGIVIIRWATQEV